MIGWDVDGTYLTAGTVTREGSFQGGEGMWAEAVLVRICQKMTVGIPLEHCS